jgi:hypothetical protein
MKRALPALALMVCLPIAARAQDIVVDVGEGEEFPVPGCGTTLARSNSSSQFGPGPWLQYTASTSVDTNICVYLVSVDAFVVGIPNSGRSDWGVFTANVSRQVPVPSYGTWVTNAIHMSATIVPGLILRAFTQSSADVRPPTLGLIRHDEDCVGEWDVEFNVCIPANSPIVINMDRHGYHLTSAKDGVLFDLDADGVLERVAWTHQDSEDAFLALDRNGNGRIDDGSELFGNHTPAYADRRDVTTENGFEALRFTQGLSYGFGMQDDDIDCRDPVWNRLLLWIDRNHNGISEPEELSRVADSGLASIGLVYKTMKRVDQFGNEFRQRAEVTWRDGRISHIFDVWLARLR